MKEAGDDGGGGLPLAGFGGELALAGFGEGVELGFAVIFGGAPFGGDGAGLFEFEEDGVEGALVDGEEVGAGLFDASGDAVAVEGAEGLEGFEDHEGEGALPNFLFAEGAHLGFQQECIVACLGKQQEGRTISGCDGVGIGFGGERFPGVFRELAGYRNGYP